MTSWNPINHSQREEDEMAMHNTPTITSTSKAFECIRENMDAKDYVNRDDVTLPKGYDMDAIEKLIARFIRETREDARPSSWRMPPLSTAYLCDDGKMRTVGQMLEGISVELMPHDEVDFDLLLFSYGVDWTHHLVPTMRSRGLLG